MKINKYCEYTGFESYPTTRSNKRLGRSFTKILSRLSNNWLKRDVSNMMYRKVGMTNNLKKELNNMS